ncbi:hypothetical protein [Methanolobus sp.]|uniref:hypothetical protein n=1 Tax=Methanolobus sp. TaxID=1874737 RepID=UPI0025F39411|nr:hypothetical protein [Methanolobus sp.]
MQNDNLIMETLLEMKQDIGEIKSGQKSMNSCLVNVCRDVENLKKEKWIRHGMAVVIASMTSFFVWFISTFLGGK